MGKRKRNATKPEKASDKGTTDKGHGLKNSFHGVAYQLKLLILILLQAAKEMKKNKKFECSISTEDPEYGKFDDIVFRFTNDDQWYLLCIQAKHKKDATESITRKDLISTSNDSPYSISKYFDSYTKSKLLQQKTDGTEKTNSPAPTLVLCTNIGLEPILVKDLMVDEKHSFEDSLLSLSIKVTKVTETNETILPKKIEKSQIKDFFKSFIIATNTLNESELSGLIVKELNESGYLRPDTQENIASKFASDHLSNRILEWMKCKESKPLEIQDIKQIFECFETLLQFLRFESMSQDYCGEIQNLNFKCKPEILKQRKLYQTLAPWLSESGNGGHKVDIWKSNEPSWVVLNILELYKSNLTLSTENQPMSAAAQHLDGVDSNPNRDQALSGKRKRSKKEKKSKKEKSKPLTGRHDQDGRCAKEKKKLSYLYFYDGKFEKPKEDILKVFFDMTFPLILVVECKQNPDIAKYLERQVKGMSSKTIKKIILIGKTDDTSEAERDLLFRDLTDGSKEQVINQTKFIHFFGTETPISELILDEDNLDFVFDIVQLSSEPRMKCNKLKKSFEKIKDMFIQRCWQLNKRKKKYGLLKIRDGESYLHMLLIQIVLQAAKEMEKNKEFKCFISTEDPKYDLFDDIVFRFTNGGQWFHLCIQTKYEEDDSITFKELISTSKNKSYSISKYFNSYLQQKTDETENTNSQPPTFVLCTNIGLEQEVKDLMVNGKDCFEITPVNSVLNSLTSETYTFDLNKIKQNDDGKLLDFLAENSDFKQLSKMLARCIYNQVNVDFRNPLFERYRGFIQNKIASNDFLSQETNNTFGVNEEFFNDHENKEFKKDFETEYRKLIKQETKKSAKQEPNSLDIWLDVRSKGIKVNKKTKTNETFAPKKMQQSQIENFFNSFIIVANTFSEPKVSKFIVNNLKKSGYFLTDKQKIFASKLAGDHLSNWIWKWMKHKVSKPFINEQDIKKHFESVRASWLDHLSVEGDLLVRDLTDESRKKVNIQIKINSFGTETPYSELIHDECSLDFILDIVQRSSEPRIKCNKLEEINDKIKEKHIHRDWLLSQNKLQITPRTSFWSAREESTTFTKLFPGSEAENDISFQTFLDLNNEKFNKILLHRKIEHINPPGVDGYTEVQVQSNSYDLYENFIKVHVIFNEAGSGKSFYLTWLASYLQDRSPSWWIIKFNLNEYGNEFGQWQERGELETKDELFTIKFLFQLVYLAWFVDNMFRMDSNEIEKKSNRAQEIAEALEFLHGDLKLDKNKMETVSSEELILLRIFVHKFNSKLIVILMDGFDEIAPYYETVVLNLLSTLETFDGICMMYLSSRPYGLRNKVKTALKNYACYRLMEFDQDDQYNFIGRYILKHFDAYKSSDDAKQKRIFCVVFAILTEILGDLMEIPLFLSKGIDLLMSEEKIGISIKEERISKQIIEDCGHSFEPLNMVEHFVEKKLDIDNEKMGKNIASSKTAAAKNDKQKKLKDARETHALLALYTVMQENDIEKLLTIEKQNTARLYMENVKNSAETLGLIEGVVSNTPIFNHMLFADYFAALWFYSNQTVPGVKDFLKREIYETNRRIEMRQFLDRMICRRNPPDGLKNKTKQKSLLTKESLHMAVLDGSKDKIESILTKDPNSITARDVWGRTPLHLSVFLPPTEGHRKIIEILWQCVDTNSANIKDKYFEWFPLDYAFCADIVIPRSNSRESLYNYDGPDWHYVVTLLNKGACIDTPEMLSRFSTKEHFKGVEDVLIIELFTERNYTPNFERFFTELVKKLGSDKVLNLEIPIDVTYKDFSGEKLGSKVFSTLNQHIREMVKDFSSSIPILEFCIMIDSVMSKIIIENSNGFKLKRPYEYYFELALKCRSINVLQYLITSLREYLKVIKDNFERELWELLAYLQNDEQEFKSLFHEYCTRHGITCREDTQLQSKEWKRGFSSRQDLMEYFPTKFEIRHVTGIDSGTEFLIARALHLDNASAVEYLFHKSNTNLDNRLIRQIYLNCKINWCCQSSYHFLLDKCTDLTGTDENGRNLLQFAAVYGDLNLVKCLMECYSFQPKEINKRENDWNAFFYCASRHRWDDDNRKNIFIHMLDKSCDEYHVDCFSQKDKNEKNVFYYAARNNWEIFHYIIQREFGKQLWHLNSVQIVDFIKLFKESSLNAKEMLEYLQFTHLNDEMKCKWICDTLKSSDELRYQDEKGRNLLHIAIMKGWFVLGKCLIENCVGFDVKEINENENNWNAFFYCVCNRENASNKLKIFTYLMEKNSFDWFGQLDSENHNVFYYALLNNVLVANYIMQNELSANNSVSVEEWASMFSKRLSESKLTWTDIDRFLTDWKQYSTSDKKHQIYYEIKSNLERMN